MTCAIDLMDCDDDSIYFLDCHGKDFYKRLICSPHIALGFAWVKGIDTTHSVAAFVAGEVRELDRVTAETFLKRIRTCMIFTRRKNPGGVPMAFRSSVVRRMAPAADRAD